MRKIRLLFTVLVCCGFYQTFSQSMYAQFSAGYALPSGSQQIGSDYRYNSETGNYTEKTVNGSYGSGLNFTGSFGYMFTSSVGLDVGINYLLGSKYTSSDIYGYTNSSFEDIIETKSSGISVTPSLLINFGGTKFSPYAKLGVVIGSYTLNEVRTDDYIENGQVVNREKEERKTTGDLAIGIRGGIGLTYMMSGNISLYGECIYTGMSYKPKETELTSSTFNGQDQIDQMYEYQKKTIYVKEVVIESFDPTKPREELQRPGPLSSIGINFGVRFAFGAI